MQALSIPYLFSGAIDVQDATVEELAKFSEFIDKAYRLWLAKPRRGMQWTTELLY